MDLIEEKMPEKPVFVVMDESNNWLYYGSASSPEQAGEYAKEADAYDDSLTIRIYEVKKEWRKNPQ